MNTAPKTTKRDFFNTLLDLLGSAEKAGIAGYDYAAMTDAVNKEIASLDKKAEQAKARAAKAKQQGDELREAIASTLTPKMQTIAEILAATQAVTGDSTLSTQKITSRLKDLKDLGRAVNGEVSIAGPDGGKSRKLSAYALAPVEG